MTAVDQMHDALFGNPPVAGFKPLRQGVLDAFTTLYNLVGAIPTSSIVNVATRTAMKALNTTTYNVAVLVEAGREGVFIQKTGSPPVTDTLEGLYVISNTASRYWQRVWDGLNGKPEWFGAVTGGPDCLAALNACVTLCPVTRLVQADYWISATWVIDISWRKVIGCGIVNYAGGEGTRILLASGTSTIIRVGPATNPGGDPGVFYRRQVHLEGFGVHRGSTLVPNATQANSARGVLINYTYECSLKMIASWENAIGFQCYGCVYTHLDDCLAFRSGAATTTVNDVCFGFHFVGSPAVLAGGNASLYVSRCAASCVASATAAPISAGFRGEGAFVDTFLFQPETNGGKNGIWFTGTGAGGALNSNIDLHIMYAICDQASGYGIHLEQLAPGAIVEIVDFYVGMPNSATAGIYIETGAGQVTISGGQAISSAGGNNVLGLYCLNQSGVYVQGMKILNCPRPVAMDTCTDFRLDLAINALSTPVVGMTAGIVCVNSSRGFIQPSMKGTAGSYPRGVHLSGAGNSLIEVNCTLIATSAISTTSADKLVNNITQITAAGAFGTNCVASGVMV